ncbi:MAG: serine/threonine-protein kinase [Chloroflexi bacterium]|nr:serine/threonine-protein kinase [Chloroflexota bacterium]
MSTNYGLLRYTLPNQPSQERPLTTPTFTIGRAEDNDLIFSWLGVWPHHGRLDCTPTATTITPALAGAPILLNNQLVTSPTRLQAGDVIQIGEGRLLFAAPVESHPTLHTNPEATLAGLTAAQVELADWVSHTTVVRHSEPTLVSTGGRTTPTEKPESAPAPPPTRRNVRTIGRYEMQDMLGYRGYLVVYRGYDPQLERTVALKLLSTQFPADDDLRAKIRREVELIAGLEHPNVVQVYDYGEHNKQPYVVMPFLDAGTLTLRLQSNGPLTLREIAPIFDELAAAIDSAHQHGLIHGQLNPNNILFDTQNKTYVSDFGISTIATAFAGDTQANYDWARYISPEQAQGLLSHNEVIITSRSDIYSLGIILFEMLTGKTPYSGNSALELAEAHLNDPLPQLADFAPQLPREYQYLFDRVLAKDPMKRYPTAARLAQHIRETAAGRWYLSQLAELVEDLPPKAAPPPPVRTGTVDMPFNMHLTRPTVTEEDILSAMMPEPQTTLPAGTPVGRYVISHLVGQGGMAAVYLARDPDVDRGVAIKMLPPNLLQRPRFRDLFHHEARLIARLRHPHIVSVFDFGEHENQPYLVMQYLPGGTLVERLAYGALTLQAITPILTNLARAVDEAHQQGIIHRDIKPANILFNAEHEAFLSDFGIAVLSAAADDKSHFAGGTPRYMSPEQAQAVLNNKPAAVTNQSDIYSLGVVLFHMLTGQVPYIADNKPIPMMQAHINEPIPSLRRYTPTLPGAWQEIINRALAKEPAARYQTAAELANDVRELSSGRWYLRQLMG